MGLESQSRDCSPGREQSFVFDKSDPRASCGDHSSLLRTPWSQPGLCFTVQEWGPERLTCPRGQSWLPAGPSVEPMASSPIGYFMALPHQLPWTEHLSCSWTSEHLCTHHFLFLPMLSSLVNPETASEIVSLTICMAWNDVVPGIGLTTSSTIISWSLMAKRDQRISLWGKGRAEGNRPHPEFMTTTKKLLR